MIRCGFLSGRRSESTTFQWRSEILFLCRFLQAQQAAKQYEEIDALNADEFDPEAQAKIAERIRRENIEANMSAAYEHSPEVFGEINMLYVNLEVSLSSHMVLRIRVESHTEDWFEYCEIQSCQLIWMFQGCRHPALTSRMFWNFWPSYLRSISLTSSHRNPS